MKSIFDITSRSARRCRHERRSLGSPSRTQRGFSLVEVLVSVFILSIGLLGSVGMQAAALKANTQTRYLNTAANMARELAEKMRGNHQIARENDAANNPFLVSHSSGTPSTPAKNCFKGECSATGSTALAEAAQWEIYEWLTKAANELPSPRIVVCFDNKPFDADGKPHWACDNLGDSTVVKMAWSNINTAGDVEYATQQGVPLVVIPLTAGSQE